ncbi:unnamed protein product [Candidula unifasciata]|uniref:Nucleolar protein 6 n=1 Tax=Candidula unifasciata TaxID=100452 RepID=A0A8S3ZC73_9EUPU|nr:unnamed protein product [Candidula unifasciata]
MKRKLAENESSDIEKTNDAAVETTKKNKKSKHGDFSGQEITRLKETEALFHSSLFRLQMSELLKEVSVKLKLQARVKEAFEALSKMVKGLSVGKVHKITDREWLQSKSIKVPLIENPASVKGVFQFLPPVNVRLSGSFVLDTAVKPDVVADVVMEIPKESFNPKDYLNQRYTRKRALYLAAVASKLHKKKRIEDLKFTYFLGNPYKPVLLVTVKGSDSKSVQLCLHAVPETDTFRLSRFHVSRNNVRPKWFLGKAGSGAEFDEEDDSLLPATPFYNSNILHDLCMSTNDSFIEKMLKGAEGLSQGIKLLKVWLRQRELSQGFGAFSSCLITAYVVYLLMTKKLNKIMNCYQVFRTTLLSLSKADWTSEAPSLYEGKQDRSQPAVDEFRDVGQSVFVDRTGYFNIAYMMTPTFFARVKHEAGLAIKALDHSHHNCFDVLFMTHLSFARSFDHIFHINLTSELIEAASKKVVDSSQKEMDLGGHLNILLSQHIQIQLSKALDRRICLVQPLLSVSRKWNISDEPYSFNEENHLTFGLVLDATCAFNILDKGPLGNPGNPEAKEFREFWGEKSEPRRFKDGTIHEAVLWTSSPCQSDRRLVCKKIVKFVLERHCGVPRRSVHYMAGKLDSLLHLNLASKNENLIYGTGEEQSLAVIRAYDQVNRALRALTSLPLSIHSIQGIHPVFRHSDVFPALPAPVGADDISVVSGHVVPKEGKSLPQFVPAMTVMCMLESSGKWPEEAEAIKCLKALFHVKMGKELHEKHLLPVSVHKTYVDVLKDGFVFRLKIANTRELAVLRTVVTDSGMIKFRETEESVALEKEIIALPHLTSLLHGLQQEHPAYSATVRLCKRWIASQMVWSLLREEAVELIVAYLFIFPHPYTAPADPSVGLMRFLHFFVTFNWKANPLMVNLNKEFSEEDLTSIPKDFMKNRATLPSMCIATPQDKTGTKWTKPTPSESHLQRLILLARESLKILESQIMTDYLSSDFKLIFRPPLEHYDLVIRLLKKANVLAHQSVDGPHEVPACVEEKSLADGQPLPVIEFNVARKYFHDLQSIFGDVAMFFHDPFGGNVIGMVWKAQATEKKDFKISLFPYRKPIVCENEVINLELQKESILDDIRVLGGGIVECIECPKQL